MTAVPYLLGRRLILPPPPNLTPSELPNRDFGPRFNDWVQAVVTGGGGDYVDGDVWMPGGTYFVDPFDLTSGGYTRSYDSNKPYNNWLRFREFDGPGTVTFELKPDSAASYYGQTQSAAYDDTTKGGSFRNTGSGSVRWAFDGAFKFQNGTFRAQNMDRILFFNTEHTYPNATWRTHWDIIRARMGVSDTGAGATIPNTGTYVSVRSNDRWKGANEPTAFRCVPVTRMYVLRANVHDLTDDGVFLGYGSSVIRVIGTLIHSIDNGSNGAGPEAWFHNDWTQVTGGLTDLKIFDCTMQGHGQFGAENGPITGLFVDRAWQGKCGIVGADLDGAWGYNIDSASRFGAGAPTTRLSGHFFKVFSNGMDHTSPSDPDKISGQSAYGANNSYGNGLNYQGAGVTSASIYNSTVVAVPTGVTTGALGVMTSSLSTFTENATVPHTLFRAAYASDELDAVMADYGISFD